MNPPLLEVRDLEVAYGKKPPVLRGVSLSLASGEILGLVGNSGCGKSTLLRALAGLQTPRRGQVLWEGRERAALTGKASLRLRRRAQLVFQSARDALDPRMRLVDAVAEPLLVHAPELDGARRRARAASVMEDLGLGRELMGRRPRGVSGGQLQRVGLARALVVGPDVLLLDEPVSALDVSIQAQVLNLLWDLRERMGLAMLLVTHDLAVVRQICDRALVLSEGCIVEEGEPERLLDHPTHEATRLLVEALPRCKLLP